MNSTLHCDGHSVQMPPLPSLSQGRARNRYGCEVSAPTGHSSMMLPLNGATYGWPSWVPTNVCAPRSVKISCQSSAISWENRTQR